MPRQNKPKPCRMKKKETPQELYKKKVRKLQIELMRLQNQGIGYFIKKEIE